MNNVSYSAVVLDETSRQRLIDKFKNLIPEGWEVIAHHSTIKMGALDLNDKLSINEEITLTVSDYAIDDKVMAVGVTGFQSYNSKPHITIAVNRQEGGKPMMSNKLTNWKRIRIPLIIRGKVTQVEYN
jgi:hypothetical protein